MASRRLSFRTPHLAPPAEELRPTRLEVPARLPPISDAAIAATASAALQPPDLLNVRPVVTVDAGRLDRALRFSFVAGTDGGVIGQAMDRAPIAASTFEPACFFEELYLVDLLRGVMQVHLDGHAVGVNERYLLRVLSQPPALALVREQRTEVWRELAESEAVRGQVLRLYGHLRVLFGLFDGEDHGRLRGEMARRRIDLLKEIERVFAALADDAFEGTTSVLSRLRTFALQVRESEAFARLLELLEYENARAFADLTLQFSADGRIRGLRINGLREATGNRYHVSRTRQLYDRLSLWLRGYRMTDAELVDRWLDEVFEGLVSFLPPLVQLKADLEVYLSGLAFRDTCARYGLTVCFPTFGDAGAACELDALFNPLLFALGTTPVTSRVELGRRGETTLLTGPNSGGKTRLLQAVGLLHVLAQGGHFVPAARATLRSVPGVFASLSQPHAADQAEGRLGTELLRMRMLFERASIGTLVVVDELCSGTSPSEGEELFRLLLELLAELRPLALISTHFLRFAAELCAEPASIEGLGLRFLRVDLDEKERPTFRFVTGVAETSLARQTAARLGVTREELRSLLHSRLGTDDRS